jgi:excisionase family DNA binding protein
MSSESTNLLDEGLRTVEEGQEFTRLSRATLYSLMERGALSYVKIGRRRLIPHRALIELAQRGLVVGSEQAGMAAVKSA